MNNPDPGPRRSGEAAENDTSASPANDLIGNILRAAEEAVAAPIQGLAPDYRSETFSLASRQRSVRSLRRKSIPIEDQRHPGKPGVKISRTTRNIDEVLEREESERTDEKEKEHSQHSSTNTIVQEDETEYPSAIALTILLISICLEVFLVSLDRTIITTVCFSEFSRSAT